MTNPNGLPHFTEFRIEPFERPSPRTWARHAALFFITFLTTTIAGTQYPFGPGIYFPPVELQIWDDMATLLAWAPTIYAMYIVDVLYHLVAYPDFLLYGLKFSVPLILILLSHEMGHYVACRIYRVSATLPYFIPTPPMIGPAGTFGAFIKIRSRIPSRKAVFDIGVAGPIAGFVVMLPFAFIGIAEMQLIPESTPLEAGMLIFSDPLLMKMIGWAYGKDPQFGIGNPFYYAAWMGALVTALNLIPSGQLDGGHALYAALGERLHRLTGKIAFVVMATLSFLGLYYFNSPSGFLIAVLLGVMMRIPHPEPWDTTPLDAKRRLIAVLTVLIFVLCFLPFPIRVT